ncbi:MAG TPA: DUF1326 domain-containing protein [Capillimicrobium sp.]|nr:DUF1326 domain-containing protein [Capillimicrobium sp.]
MSWRLEGRYFENCSCDVPCPCTASLALGADYDRCQVLLAFQVDRGEVDGVDVSGLTVAVLGDTPKVMADGDWRLGLVVDASASDEQAEKLAGVFSGQLGGPMEGLAPLVGENLGLERASMRFESRDGRHTLELGDAGRIEVEDVVPVGAEPGSAVRMSGVFHPANTELTIGRAGDSRIRLFGLEPSLAGQSGFSAPFAWSA